MRINIKLILLFLLSSSFVQAQIDFVPVKSISQIEQEHKLLSELAYPNPNTSIIDSLLNQDFKRFNALLDIAFVFYHDSLYDSRMYDLISQLETESLEKKQLITALELSVYEKEALIALDQSLSSSISFQYWRHIVRTLVLGYEVEDFVVKARGDSFHNIVRPNQITRKHYFNIYGSFQRERKYLQEKLIEYISNPSFKDHKSYYQNLVIDAYSIGVIQPDYKYSVIKEIVKQEVLSENDIYLNDYRLLIEQIELQEALDLIDLINNGRNNNYYPQVFLDLLSSENDDIVAQIIGWSSTCWDQNKCVLVKDKIDELFRTGSRSLKFKAAFTLMHDYDDLDAYNYLISIVEAEDSGIDELKYTAISWLGDTCNNGKQMSTRLDSVLKPYLNSENPKLKRATIETYLTYNSQNVIEAIIPFADYELDFIAKKIYEKILSYKDKSFTIDRLQNHLLSKKGSKVHLDILKKLE